jgi:hypothetical protein
MTATPRYSSTCIFEVGAFDGDTALGLEHTPELQGRS